MNVRMCLATLLVGSAFASAAPTETNPTDLVTQLGDRSYKLRAAANQELVALRQAAVPALRVGLTSADPEIRSACERLLVLAQRSDEEWILARFDAGILDPQTAKLPCWQAFKDLVGEGREERDLFISMYSADPKLMTLAANNPGEARKRLAERIRTIQNALYGGFQRVVINGRLADTKPSTATFADVAQIYFLASLPNLKVDGTTFHFVSSTIWMPLVNQNIMAKSVGQKLLVHCLKSAKHSTDCTVLSAAYTAAQSHLLVKEKITEELLPVIRKVLKERSDQLQPGKNIYEELQLARQVNVPETLELGLKVIREKQFTAQNRAEALLIVARQGKKEHLPVVEPLMSDTTVVGTTGINGVALTAQLRDVALAAAITMTGQKVRDYDFPFFKIINFDMGFVNPSYYGFSKEEERAATLKKFRDWQSTLAK
jgi:hypothetical protein